MYLEYQGFFSAIRNHYFRKLLRMFFRGKGRILDFGCGPGDFLIICAQSGVEVTGVDDSDYSIGLAKARGLSVVRVNDFNQKPVEQEYELILLQSVVEHLHEPVEVLRGLSNRLLPGGRMIVSAPTPGPHFWDDPTHIRPFTPASFLRLADIIGLKVIYGGYVGGFLIGIELRANWIFKALNLFSFPFGSNLVFVYEKSE